MSALMRECVKSGEQPLGPSGGPGYALGALKARQSLHPGYGSTEERDMRRIDKCHFVFALCGAVLCTMTVRADPIEDFYKGKTVSIITSTGVGGAFDLTARALAKHMPRYI